MSGLRRRFEIVGCWTRPDGPVHESLPDKENGVIRIVAVSDTHGFHRRVLPEGDILIHGTVIASFLALLLIWHGTDAIFGVFPAGDFTNYGRANEIRAFTKWLAAQSHPHKLVIAGNHEYSLDANSFKAHFQGNSESDETEADQQEQEQQPPPATTPEAKRELLRSVCTYLENETVTICGIKFYCSPINIGMGAFGVPRGSAAMKEFWRAGNVPQDIDILVTHGPPSGNRALDRFGRDAGDETVRDFVLANKATILAHIFGHIHESYGVSVEDEVHFVNAAVVHRAAAVVLDLKPILSPPTAN